jgi:AcrR family transcriptional regulator
MTLKSPKPPPFIIALDRANGGATSEDPRRLRTRTALINAAQKLFSERTFEMVSVDYITEAAGVAKGSFYNHFSDKQGLATEIGSLLYRYVVSLIDEDAKIYGDPASRCVRGTMIMARFALEQPESAKALLRLSRDLFTVNDPLNSRVVEIIKAGIEDGTFNDVGVEDGFMLLVGTGQMLVQQAVDSLWPGNVKLIAQRCCMNMLRGFGVKLPKARRISEDAANSILKGF